MKQKAKTLPVGGCEVLFLLSLLLTGGFLEYLSCALAAAAAVLLVIRIARQKRVAVRLNLVAASVAAIALGYLVTVLYAVDKAMAYTGFLRFLPVLLFAMLLMQDETEKERLLERLPWYAAGAGLISLLLMYIPLTQDYVAVAGRLGGFFQYPNTFAMLLLAAELLLVSRERRGIREYVLLAVLCVLLLWTGSRAVFVLGLLSNGVMIFLKKGRRNKIIVAAVAAALTAAWLLLMPLLHDNAVFGRFFSLSLGESTFAGRILYTLDALPLALSHPFGMGYLGYSYMEQSVQTGVYSVRFVHNDILQLALDIGWVPCLGFLAAFAASLCSGRLDISRKVILVTFLLHLFFDMDLQFVSMFFLFLLLADTDGGRQKVFKTGSLSAMCLASLLGLMSAYFAFALGFARFGNTEACRSLYAPYTQNIENMMIATEEVEEQNALAEEILSHNEYHLLSWSAKAHYAYSQGDFEALMQYKHRIFTIAPFAYDEYEEYAEMLLQGMQLYMSSGDMKSAQLCREELRQIPERLSSLENRLSYWGTVIDDQPQTKLPQKLSDAIESL